MYCLLSLISVLASQGADGVRGLKGNKGEKVGALRLLDWKSKKVAVWKKKTLNVWETEVFVRVVLEINAMNDDGEGSLACNVAH